MRLLRVQLSLMIMATALIAILMGMTCLLRRLAAWLRMSVWRLPELAAVCSRLMLTGRIALTPMVSLKVWMLEKPRPQRLHMRLATAKAERIRRLLRSRLMVLMMGLLLQVRLRLKRAMTVRLRRHLMRLRSLMILTGRPCHIPRLIFRLG